MTDGGVVAQSTELQVKNIPNIAQRALQLINLELLKTISEAADLVDVDLNAGWTIADDMSCFVRTVAVEPEEPEG